MRMKEERMRTFLALPIREDVRKKVNSFVKEVSKRIKSKVKWVEEENLHFTIFFFGEIDKREVERIESVIKEKTYLLKKFNVRLNGLSFFPNERRVRVVWIGVKEGGDEMKSIYGALYPEFSRFLKIRKENFVPHLTIGRAKFGLSDSEVKLLKDGNLITPLFKMDRLILFESKLTPNGPIYTPLRTFLFK